MDEKPLKSNVAVLAAAGSRLKFGARVRGARAYLAIAGGIDVPPVLGSRATHVISAMGGMAGRALRAGDQVPVGSARTPQRTASPLSDPVSPLPDGQATVRVLPGPQAERFAPDALDVLQSAPYVIAQNSDRMGFRLEGPRLVHSGSADIISDATPLGVLQVPAAGQPILLMADRQTSGGYPKLATVIAADVPVAAQLAPGDRLSFQVCTPQVALGALIAQERVLLAMESA
jgi:antagonist of KipI